MRAGVNRITAFSGAVAVLVLAASARADETDFPDDRWVPSLAVIGGVEIQNWDASVASSCTTAPCSIFVDDGGVLRPPASGSDVAVSPYVGAGLELMTPAVPIPGRPRVFVTGEILPTFSSSRDPAKEADPTGIDVPDPTRLPEEALTGVGSRTSAEVDLLAYGARMGVAIPFHIRGRRLYLKPSAGWLRYTIDAEGRVVAGLKNEDPPGAEFGDMIREVDLKGHDSLALDAIGPGFELELEAARRGPIGVSVFLEGHAYHVLGDRTMRFSESVSLTGSELEPNSYTADWSFEADPWVFRAGLGLRVHWIGN